LGKTVALRILDLLGVERRLAAPARAEEVQPF
jgi:hypothetical protein